MIALVPFLISLLLMPLVAWTIYKTYDWLLNAQLRKEAEQPLSEAPVAKDAALEPASRKTTPQDHSFRDYVYAFTIGAKPTDISNVNRVWRRLLAEELATDIILVGIPSSAIILKGRQFEEQHLTAAPVAGITAVMKRKTSRLYEVLESGEAEKFHIGPLGTSHVFEESAANGPARRP